MTHRKMQFGKYKGTDIDYLCRTNPDYIHWCITNINGFYENMTQNEKDEYDKGYKEKVNLRHNREIGGFLYDFENEMNSNMIHNLD